ncbi:CD226 antigen isoform X2 [Rhinatrema bivittatum]|uniref:CD226 antigen isoform X2 n=1 Tax=Rhinatrema bivittatum TaxID=194408 RepID=UPI00112ECE32|nr:CD226 antigen isoform X2 [Rhinatrema bivittatum]
MDYLIALVIILQIYETTVMETPVDTTIKLTESMVLECVYPGTGKVTQVSWVKGTGPQKVTVLVADSIHGVHIDTMYKEKVDFANVSSSSRDMSLQFHRTSAADMGYYYCSVHTFPDGIWEKVIKVVQSDDFGVAVAALHHVFAEPGQNVTFSCQYTLGSKVKQVTWEKIRGGQIDTIASCNLSDGKIYGSDYKARMLVDCPNLTDSSTVVIQNVSTIDEGLYHCRFDADTGNQTFVMNLTINKEIMHHLFIPLVAGGGGLLLLFILITIITVCLVKRKRKKKKKMQLKVKCKFSTRPQMGGAGGRENNRKPCRSGRRFGDCPQPGEAKW